MALCLVPWPCALCLVSWPWPCALCLGLGLGLVPWPCALCLGPWPWPWPCALWLLVSLCLVCCGLVLWRCVLFSSRVLWSCVLCPSCLKALWSCGLASHPLGVVPGSVGARERPPFFFVFFAKCVVQFGRVVVKRRGKALPCAPRRRGLGIFFLFFFLPSAAQRPVRGGDAPVAEWQRASSSVRQVRVRVRATLFFATGCGSSARRCEGRWQFFSSKPRCGAHFGTTRNGWGPFVRELRGNGAEFRDDAPRRTPLIRCV